MTSTGGCLQMTEADGMEGESDAMAEWSKQEFAIITDNVMGDYVMNNKNGVRTHTSASTQPPSSHRFSTTAKTKRDGTQDNVLFLHLFLKFPAYTPATHCLSWCATRTATAVPTSACCRRPLLVGDLASTLRLECFSNQFPYSNFF
ncbi:uncharacterized protein LACBIDRAFT_302304 [Laccaria bicolor S238N-H82]|uniref:Extracellular metalloproteinase n=1 Tax=Laccaria bicolor (strain S238N-H82 / ATCC MYA-4686) TaxID=486041 RepID=B0DHI0_LACBS|nr:uncharacterized protein LACBIDRAFT_302304 [Laccaria bicolor S238N-H82]EDR06107.1 predicted protein [Laccaria bicolor S238N-H82]|eukprot:XP_001883395.1 predicted protein [Laccaria bicolor S238N-H82]